MNNMTITKTLNAPRSSVWAILADFSNVADWNPAVEKSHATSEAVGGVGATRHCDLAPMGTTEESVIGWEPEERIVIKVDDSELVPFKEATAIFALEGTDDTTDVTVSFEFAAEGDPQIGEEMEKQLAVQFEGVLAGLEAAAKKATQS